MKQPVTQPLELPRAGLVFEAKLPGPGGEVLSQHHEPKPDAVVLKALERQVREPAVLGLADPVLDPGVTAVAKIEDWDIVVLLVGEEDRQAVALVVGERLLVAFAQLCAPGDQPRASGQAERSTRAVISLTCECSRSEPSGRIARSHADSNTSAIASRTSSVRSKPTEKRIAASRQ